MSDAPSHREARELPRAAVTTVHTPPEKDLVANETKSPAPRRAGQNSSPNKE